MSDLIADWLLDEDSLTSRLKKYCQGQFRVQVLSQARRRPMIDESSLLMQLPRTVSVVRQVLLRCNDTPWVFARTVIPVSTLTGGQWRLTRLGRRPLGEALFTDKRARRGPIIPLRVSPGTVLHGMVGPHHRGEPLWGRRSLFWYGERPLLITELFLPQMWLDIRQERKTS